MAFALDGLYYTGSEESLKKMENKVREGLDLQPVLFEIMFEGRNQLFRLDNDRYSSFPEEQEVLLQDGIEYKIISHKKEPLGATSQDD